MDRGLVWVSPKEHAERHGYSHGTWKEEQRPLFGVFRVFVVPSCPSQNNLGFEGTQGTNEHGGGNISPPRNLFFKKAGNVFHLGLVWREVSSAKTPCPVFSNGGCYSIRPDNFCVCECLGQSKNVPIRMSLPISSLPLLVR